MKLIIQIPCHNEAQTLPATIRDLPREIGGVDTIEILVIDDGSCDGTSDVARDLGVHHIVRHRNNRGLAKAFATGVDYSLRAGADIIVNTDGDNQYFGGDVAGLVQPILSGRADIVIGDRRTWSVKHFSLLKRILQRIGSQAVRSLSATDIPDAVSGFRAMSREAAIKLNVLSSFSFTIETLIQAGQSRLAVTSVPVKTNPRTRPSRLFKSIPQFLRMSGATMLRAYALHRPLLVFLSVGFLLLVTGGIPILRFLYFSAIGQGQGHVQSLVLGTALSVIASSCFILGLLADLIAANRKLLEINLEKCRKLEIRMEELARQTHVRKLDDSPAENRSSEGAPFFSPGLDPSAPALGGQSVVMPPVEPPVTL